jgi:RNA polymerase subunit RPABC4/transcription elongation factor Spt4
VPATLGYFGISNDGVNLAINLLVLFLAIVWLAMIYWTRADAKRRITDPVLVLCATAAALFPFVGTIVYMIVRPPEYLEDVRERELEMAASEARLAQLSYYACENCGTEVEKDYLICPSCHTRLREACDQCHRALDLNWSVCPYCEAPAIGARSHRRRREAFVPGEMPPAP